MVLVFLPLGVQRKKKKEISILGAKPPPKTRHFLGKFPHKGAKIFLI